MMDLILLNSFFFDFNTPKKETKNTTINEYVVEILNGKSKKNVKIGIVIKDPPAPNKPNNTPDKKKKKKPIKFSISKS